MWLVMILQMIVFQDEQLDVLYSCLRCDTKVSVSELSRLPEIKCICGFRVFTKVRRPVVKSVKASIVYPFWAF